MEDITDIQWGELGLIFLLMAIPLGTFWYYGTGQVKSTLTAILRMAVQLILVGLYLGFIFDLDAPWLNMLWVVVMVGVGGYTTVTRAGLVRKPFMLIPILLGLLISVALMDAYTFGFVIDLGSPFHARYFIPISGMMIGNSMRSSIIGLEVYYHKLGRERTLYRYAIANGATHNEALRPFMREALQRAFDPAIATMATVGIISLPGMMTGQILGGSDPMIAIKYQIVLMVIIFVSSVINVLVGIFLADRYIFDERPVMRRFVLRR